MRLLFYIFLFFLGISEGFAQYIFQWDRYIGNDLSETASDIIQTYDGNFIILGQKKGYTDALWLIKITAQGQNIWSKKYYGYPFIYPQRVIETKDKGLLVVSEVKEKEHSNSNLWLLRLDAGGHKIWERLYTFNENIYPTCALQTFDGNFVIGGYKKDSINSDADWYILETDSIGFFIRDAQFGSPYEDKIYDVTQLPDSSLIFVGFTSYQKGALRRAAFYRTDKNINDIIYSEIKDYKWSEATTVIGTKDTSFVLALDYIPDTIGELNNIAVIKYDSLNIRLWKREIEKNAICYPRKIINTFDDGYLLAYTIKYDGEFNYNAALIKFSPHGKIVWEKIFTRKSNDYVASVVEAKDNGIYVLATTYSKQNGWNFAIAKFKSLEYTRLRFLSPLKNILTVTIDTISIRGCIKSFKPPKHIDIYVNRDSVLRITRFKKIDTLGCNYFFVAPVRLFYGENKIIFKLTDYKDYVFIKSLNVYFLPPPSIHW